MKKISLGAINVYYNFHYFLKLYIYQKFGAGFCCATIVLQLKNQSRQINANKITKMKKVKIEINRLCDKLYLRNGSQYS